MTTQEMERLEERYEAILEETEPILLAAGGTKSCPDCLGCGLNLRATGRCVGCLGRGRVLYIIGPRDDDQRLYEALVKEFRQDMGRAPGFLEKVRIRNRVKESRKRG